MARAPSANLGPVAALAAALGPQGNYVQALDDLAKRDIALTAAMGRLAQVMQGSLGQAYGQFSTVRGIVRETAMAQMEASQARAQAAVYQTPAGKALAGQQMQAQGQSTVAQLQAQAAQLQAQTSYLQTPQGQAQAQARAVAQRQVLQAQEEHQRATNVAAQGKLTGTIMNTAAQFAKLNPYIAAAAVAADTFKAGLNLAGHANPQTGATSAQSWDLLKARVGTFFIPAVDSASHAVQKFGRTIEGAPGGGMVGQGVSWLSNILIPSLGAMKLFNVAFGKEEPMKKALPNIPGVGTAQPLAGSYEQAAMSFGLTTLTKSEIEMETLRVAVENMTAALNQQTEEMKKRGEIPRKAWRDD